MKKICVTLNGEIINIGPWDYQKSPQLREVIDGEEGEEGVFLEPVFDANGEQLFNIGNPLPEGAIEENIEVVQNQHGLFAVRDYKRLRRHHYPPINEQLDAIHKAIGALLSGAQIPEDAQALLSSITNIKKAFPKC